MRVRYCIRTHTHYVQYDLRVMMKDDQTIIYIFIYIYATGPAAVVLYNMYRMRRRVRVRSVRACKSASLLRHCTRTLRDSYVYAIRVKGPRPSVRPSDRGSSYRATCCSACDII